MSSKRYDEVHVYLPTGTKARIRDKFPLIKLNTLIAGLVMSMLNRDVDEKPKEPGSASRCEADAPDPPYGLCDH